MASCALACVTLATSCAPSGATTWLPALGVATRIGLRDAPSAGASVDTRIVATWGGGSALPAPLDHASLATGDAIAPSDAAPVRCPSADACAWERRARAIATRVELARLRRHR